MWLDFDDFGVHLIISVCAIELAVSTGAGRAAHNDDGKFTKIGGLFSFYCPE